ncbi:MAG: transglycosylase SLT domain-containing protein [Betaproteobacteria bacterium]|nr:transglycosylase SLT domain-containing protein [Betaproteobacteria bacterium]
MRSSFFWLSHVALVVLLAACATPAPPPPPAIAAPVAPPETAVVVAVPRAAADYVARDVAADLEPLPPPADDLWVRIRRGFAMPDIDEPLVDKWEQWYASRPDYVERMLERSRRYLYYIVVEVEERGMPLELALLPMVESAFNPNATSVARASGIWQFMPSTGKHYGLKQNFWFDSRRDVVAATEGALTYLEKLHADFDDWQLALAGYNWGEGNVARAIAKNRKKGLPAGYADLKMPDETRNYLPKLQALKNIVRDPGKYGLDLGDIPDAPYFTVVKTDREIDVKKAAQLAEMPIDEFRYLNPQHNRPVIAGADKYTILLPIDRAELFAAKLQLEDQPLVSWQAYRMRKGESLAQVATKYGLEIDALRAVNGIGAKARVPAGHMLLVPTPVPTDAAAETLSDAVFTTVPQGRTFYYRIKRGDTLSGIASRYAVTTAELRRWNGLTRDVIKAGQSLRITSDLAPAAGTVKRAAGTGASGGATRAKGKAAKSAGPGKDPSVAKSGSAAGG